MFLGCRRREQGKCHWKRRDFIGEREELEPLKVLCEGIVDTLETGQRGERPETPMGLLTPSMDVRKPAPVWPAALPFKSSCKGLCTCRSACGD